MKLLPIVMFVAFADEISSPTATYDFFGTQLPVPVISAIVATIFFSLGGFGLVKSLEMIVKAIKKVHFKLTWKPITAALALTGICIGALIYYVPFGYLCLGIKPTFGPHLAIHGQDNAMQVSWRTATPAPTIVYWGEEAGKLDNVARGGEFYWQDTGEDTYHHCVLLDNLVAGHEYYYKVPSLGQPMYSTSVRGGSQTEEDLARQLEPIFYKYRVNAVFYGHDHVFEAFHVNASEPCGGMMAFTVAGGGGSIKDVQNPEKHTNPLHAWESNVNIVSNYTDGRFDDIYGHQWQLYAEATHHYMVVEVDGDVATFSAYRAGENSLIKSYTMYR